MASSSTLVTSSADLRRRQRRHRRATPLWTLFSLLFHGAAFLLLVRCTPLREVAAPRSRAVAANVTARRLEELSRTLAEIHWPDLVMRVEDLEAMRAEMEELRREMLARYDDFAARQAATATETLATLINETATLQRDALTRQEAALTAAEDDDGDASRQEAVGRQVLALETLEKARQQAALTSMERSAAALAEAARAQETANVRQVEALRLGTEMRQAHEAAQRAAAEAEKAAQEHEKAVAQTETAAAQAAQAAESRQAAGQRTAGSAAALQTAQAATRAAEETQRKADAGRAAEAREKLAAARAAERAAAEAHKQEETRLRQAAAAEAQAADKAARALRAGRERQEEREKKTAAAQTATRAAEEARSAAAASQETAVAEQRRAAAALLAAARVVVAETPDPRPLSAAFAGTAPGTPRRMDIVDLYALARELEGRIAETYRDVRAAEIAVLRGLPFEQARALTDVATPLRPPLDAAALRGTARDAAAFERRKEEIAKALRESQGMVETSRSLLNVARSLAGEGTALGGEGFAALTRWQAAVAAAAAENKDQRAKDLAALMRRRATDEEHDDGSHVDRSRNHPLLTDQTPHVNPGTIAGANSVATSWMYADSWYVIGPFPNPQRANIDRKFPPETVVDLDASYVGKDGRVIRWTHHKSPRIAVVPDNAEPYGIWYAWTELFFPEDCDRWIAVGSDDKSKIWINDILVWESVSWHKSWRINEGYRRVHFQRGRNRVLYRVENGHHGMAWSLAVHLGEG